MSVDGTAAHVAAAVSAALADPGPDRRDLLSSIVSVARAVFGAAAGSILLLDERTGELVFEATAGQGEEHLVGSRFPAGRGIAGWVAATGEAMIARDLADNAVFARDVAESTRYVPDSIMAAPVACGEVVLGVLEVLDPAPQSRSSLSDLDLLTMLAGQAGIALRGVARDTAARRTLAERDPDYPLMVDVIRLMLGWDSAGREAGYRMLETLGSVLGTPGGR
jgi:GAF domain-containing protein